MADQIEGEHSQWQMHAVKLQGFLSGRCSIPEPACPSEERGGHPVVANGLGINEEDNGLAVQTYRLPRQNGHHCARPQAWPSRRSSRPPNSEYAFYHTFTLDGTYQLKVKLTGMLNTYCLHPSEQATPLSAEVAKGIDAQNHQRIFSLHVNPEIDGPNNTVMQSDATPSPLETTPSDPPPTPTATASTPARDASAPPFRAPPTTAMRPGADGTSLTRPA
ncbi:peroxisomal copper amine oxidase [Aspergillus clavatus NRRL 1]|uniref:Amine oxidase n=1 Tax=Aspergillus clavatus (strain ATCC 1007 / CBS 513.65 / DSM 816 / NCTC 3887 / NRRL 1 / QM 1276 / 107) TaxID=344612 RepID=A1C5J7_ASPCL|nr:uncharacterized protein ACLA_003780 [Aspergillus clavatus NRRL 1]EAW14965.1 hypothetical protein ACLA_003780 [Aspergillus clavatus NRRL 1]